MKPACPKPDVPLSSLDVFVLCGGLGTRLRPAVSDVPKCLAPVGGRPFLVWLLDSLSSQGLRRFVLCVGFRADAVESTRPFLEGFGELRFSREERPLGTGGALRAALPNALNEPLLVVNGDSLAAVDLASMLHFHRARGAAATIALAPASADTATNAAGSVRIDADGRIISFQEKSSAAAPFLNAGVYFIGNHALPEARESFSLEYDVFPLLVRRGQLFGFPSEGGFYDIGTPERYAAAHRALARIAPTRRRDSSFQR